MDDRSGLPGLQAERTSLAWERTALALLANGALVFLRFLDGSGATGGALGVGVLAVFLAVAVAVGGVRRAGRVGRAVGAVPVARGALLATGGAVAALGAGVVVVLVLGW